MVLEAQRSKLPGLSGKVPSLPFFFKSNSWLIELEEVVLQGRGQWPQGRKYHPTRLAHSPTVENFQRCE